MKIATVEAIPFAIPLIRPLSTALGTAYERDILLVRLRSDDGLVGIGEGVVTPYFTGETLASAREAVERYFTPVLVGRNPIEFETIATALDRAMFANWCARAAVDIALYDLAGKALGLPVYQLLGGRQRDQVPATRHIGNFDPAADAEEAAEAVEQGFGVIKLKVGLNEARDLEAIRRVRAAIGERRRLYLDANQAWTPKTAIRFIHAAEEEGVEFVEQPTRRGDVEAMAQVAAAVDAAIAPDEGCYTAEELMRYIRQDAADAILLKVCKTMGITGGRRVVTLAEAAGIAVFIAGMPGETSISAAAALHLALAARRIEYGTGIAPHYSKADVVVEPIRPIGGVFKATDRPGLGVELDEEKLERCRLDR